MRKTQPANIDTEIRHVTGAATNIFSELGFSPEDARRFECESRERIDHALALKEQLMSELTNWIALRKLKQSEAALILHVTRPRISDVVNKKTSKFTIDALVDMLARAGKPVKIVVG
ncbi:helix-turn-helix domain-containing protein [Massilia glaciei]|uniref:XRE family transcriptional regulator n=1 Tax=Massilia glaciei TaxID=1524097 RepID=A0A2U2I6F2_9BURK|nr:XRE family transcriptional regulator [Massilia glaciei]PWF55255.1 XRE family transcriptional regulator [Massilia glaciei]